MWVSKAKKVRDSHAGDCIKIDADSQVHIFRDDRRRLAPRTGTNSLLVIRGISLDGAPTKTAAQLADDVFGAKGNGTDVVNLVTQFNACSNGVLQYNPAKGNNITNGVAEVFVNYNLNGTNRFTAHNYFINAATNVVGPLNRWTQVMVVMQSNVIFEGVGAYSYINHWLSVYQNTYASNVMVQMHELGHNLGMYHSGEGNSSYLDHTCMMGNSQFADDAPIQCFNGAKSWFLGWYADRHKTVIPTTSSWDGLVAGVNDYVQGQTTAGVHHVVVKIDNTSSSTDLYMMYNKREGMNSGVVKYPNLITIVSASNGVVSDQSWLVAALNATQTYRASGFSGQAYDLVIKVCTMVAGTPDYARVLVYLDNGVDNLSCSTPTPVAAAPTSRPTLVPTPFPTPAPTPVPTTVAPTRAPMPLPTEASANLLPMPVRMTQARTCLQRRAACSSNLDCCSGRCKRRRRKCL